MNQLPTMRDECESVNCIICGRDDTSVFLEGPGAVRIVKCRNDGLLYLNPRPKLSSIHDIHTRYVRADNLDMFSGYRQEVLAREAAIIKRFKPSGKLLDIGCATGTFFEGFVGGAWNVYGVEPSPLGVELAKKEHGADVYCGTLVQARYPSEFFDVVSILDTLFYSVDPAVDLREIRRILKKDGLLAVEIPGLTYRLFRDRGPLCWLLDRKWRRMTTDSWHLYYFSPLNLRRMVEKCGFEVKSTFPCQASFGRGRLASAVNRLHFALARGLFSITSGRVSIAGKELYLASKRT